MVPQELDTDQLLQRAGRGDAEARQQLLVRHRQRLRQMIALRMDRRLAARLDPSDVVQETLGEAIQQLSEYLRRRPLPFYPWLRQLALDRLAELHRRHIQARKRSVTREEAQAIPDESVLEAAPRLVDRRRTSAARGHHIVVLDGVRAAVSQLTESNRLEIFRGH